MQVKGLKELVAKIDGVHEMRPLRDLLVDASNTAVTASKPHVPQDTGALLRDIQPEIMPFSAKVPYPKPYAVIMEGGRKPGGKMPPPHVLDAWARRHGIDNTFLLARAIARRGLKGRFFRRKGRSAVRKQMPHLLERMGRQLEAIWGKPVADA